MSASAYGAATLKYASPAALHTPIASDRKPIGASRNVIGSSFSAERKTNATLTTSPRRSSGNVTAKNAATGDLPSARAASSSRAGAWYSALRTGPTPSARKCSA